MTRMSTTWRVIAPVVVAGVLVAAGMIPAHAASPATYKVSITASDKLGPFYGYTLVFYKTAKYDTASIRGKVTGASAGDVAALLAEPFGAKSFAPTGAQVKLAGGTAPYSFTVKPVLATRYKVQVLTGSHVDVTSVARTVYVAPGGYSTSGRTRCSHGRCTTSWKSYTLVPASAYKTESSKRLYFYFALARHRPTYLYRFRDASASRARKISAGDFEITVAFHYTSRLKNPAPDVYAEYCTLDTERKDGLGLPRPTGCGSKKVPTYSYVG
jgi:hypothetical protein